MYYYIFENGDISSELFGNEKPNIKVLKTEYKNFVKNIPIVENKIGIAIANIALNKLDVLYYATEPVEPIEPTPEPKPVTNEEIKELTLLAIGISLEVADMIAGGW